MPNNYMKNLAAAFLRAKLAAQTPEEAMHEQAETPEQEQLEHAPGGYEEGGELPGDEGHEQMEAPEAEGLEHMTGGPEEGGEEMGGLNPDEDAHLDQMLSQLPPEELDQLAEQLAGEMQGGPATGPAEGGEDVGELAQAIEQHLAQNPEASIPQAAPEKMAALEFVKSASYIEGFLNQAIDRGVSVKQAVDMYDQSLTNTIQSLKQAELKGKQHKLDVDHDGKIEAEDLKKLREGKKDKTAEELREEIKTAAYYEGMIERAREYGLSDYDTVNFVKEAGLPLTRKSRGKDSYSKFKKKLLDKKIKTVGENIVETAGGLVGMPVGLGAGAVGGGILGYKGGKKLTERNEKEAAARKSSKTSPKTSSGMSPGTRGLLKGMALGGAVGAGGGALVGGGAGMAVGAASRLADSKKEKEKKAYELGLIERAREYGLSEQEAFNFIKNAGASSAVFRAAAAAAAAKGGAGKAVKRMVSSGPVKSKVPTVTAAPKAKAQSPVYPKNWTQPKPQPKPQPKVNPKAKPKGKQTGYEQAKEDAKGIRDSVSGYIRENPLKSTGAALGAGAVGGYLAGDEK